jgi:hypothetical protein
LEFMFSLDEKEKKNFTHAIIFYCVTEMLNFIIYT